MTQVSSEGLIAAERWRNHGFMRRIGRIPIGNRRSFQAERGSKNCQGQLERRRIVWQYACTLKKENFHVPRRGRVIIYPERESHVCTLERESHVCTPERESHVCTPERESHVCTPERENHFVPRRGRITLYPGEGESLCTPERENHVVSREEELSCTRKEGIIMYPERKKLPCTRKRENDHVPRKRKSGQITLRERENHGSLKKIKCGNFTREG